MDTFNIQLFLWMSHNPQPQPLLDSLAVFFSEAGPTLLMVGLILCWLKASDMHRPALLEATAAAGLGLLYFHPRPFMLGLIEPLVAHAPENSFPSDHATLMLSVALYLLCRRGWRGMGFMLLLVALTTAWARIYVGIHFPFDMAGSLGVALLSGSLVLGTRQYLASSNALLLRLYHWLKDRLIRRECRVKE